MNYKKISYPCLRCLVAFCMNYSICGSADCEGSFEGIDDGDHVGIDSGDDEEHPQNDDHHVQTDLEQPLAVRQ